ncbi:MAG: peptide chain release factor 1, partial [Candidatus Cloacimonetes bacterium]|nr:peptide chain release factor 1 [Candidatus Cloacimonadota bacterium]
LEEARQVLESERDQDLLDMAVMQKEEAEEALETATQELKLLLLPRDPADSRNCLLEIRAGAGGDEAALFAGDLCRMYQRYAELMRWKLEVLTTSEGVMGGYKEITIAVKGEEAFGTLKYEGGVHRVQRVPSTESQGRVHTSAASVAVLPEAEEVDMHIDAREVRVDVYRSSGPGGQSVNTTDSAVRLTHLPTGMIVTCQDEKSQIKNKEKAMKVLRSRLLDLKLREEKEKQDSVRRSQVGSGDRSAKIRTYNFPQNRVTDHRINLTLHRLDSVMEGGIQPLLEALRLADVSERMEQAGLEHE